MGFADQTDLKRYLLSTVEVLVYGQYGLDCVMVQEDGAAKALAEVRGG